MQTSMNYALLNLVHKCPCEFYMLFLPPLPYHIKLFHVQINQDKFDVMVYYTDLS